MNGYSNFNEQPRPEVPPEQTPGFVGYPQSPMPQHQSSPLHQTPMQQYPQQPMVYPQQVPMQPMYPQQQMMPQQQMPMQGQYPQQIPMPMAYPQQQMMYPQQQPMMMAPQPINVVVNNNNTAMAGVGVVGVVRRRNTPMLLSIIYFCFIGCWLGFYWALIGFVLSALGKDAGRRMMGQLPMIFFLRQSASTQPMMY